MLTIFLSIFLVNAVFAEDNLTLIEANDVNNFDSIQTQINDANPGDKIYLDNVTYSGNGDSIKIDKDIDIYGESGTVLDANSKSNIFLIGKNVNVNLIGLTLINGNSKPDDGGAIYNNGKLTISNSAISKNLGSCGCIYNSKNAELTIDHSILDNNKAGTGGTIYNDGGIVKIINSTITHSVSGDGGAIYTMYGTLTIRDSRMVANNGSFGGVLYNNAGNVKIYDSYLASNHASELGGAIKNWGYCEIYGSVVANNSASDSGGGLYTFKYSMKITNSIVENNTASLGGGIFCDAGSKLDILNSSLSNNRAEDGGAIYINEGALNVKDSSINNNNAGKDGGAIYLKKDSATIFNSTISKNTAERGGAIYNGGTLSIDICDFISNKARFGAIYNGNSLTVDRSNFNLNEGYIGGVLYNEKNSTIKNSKFMKNKAFDAGAIYTTSTLTVDNCEFRNHEVTHSCGVMEIVDGDVNISNSLFESNTGADQGGCIFTFEDSNVVVNNSRFLSNKAKSYGAAIDNSGNMIVENCLFNKNQATGAPAIDNGGNLTVINSNFTNNKASKNGGAIDTKGLMSVTGCIFTKNSAAAEGGAIISRGDSNITNSSFIDNKGGVADAIYLNDVVYDINDNWWGSNYPDFKRLVNVNLTNEFRWIKIPVATKLSAPELTVVYNAGKYLLVTLKDSNNNPIRNVGIKVDIVGKTYTIITDNLGQAKLPINLKPGTYPATVRYPGNADYAKATAKTKVIVKKANPQLTASKRTFYANAKNKKVTATLKDNRGNVLKNTQLVLKVNGKSYYAKTNSNGIATFAIKLTKKGNYYSTVKFNGNGGYNALTKGLYVLIK